MPDRPLEGRRALVTGATGGLGEAVARALHRAGAGVLAAGRSPDRLRALAEGLQAEGGAPAEWCAADLAQPEGAGRLAARAREVFPRLDILVNNAAVQGPIGRAWENDPEAWSLALRVNLLAPVELCRLCVPWMARGGGGSIVNVSGGGAAGPRACFSAYAASKAALVRYGETLAQEAAGLGIRVNSIAPGAMLTAMTRQVLEAGGERAGEREFRLAGETAAGGATPPDRAAALVVFLASDTAAGISGRLISAVWDPWESLPDRAAELAGTDIYTLRRIVPGDRGRSWE